MLPPPPPPLLLLPLPVATSQVNAYLPPLSGPHSKYRLDVLPFLVLYALWGCFVVETLATSGFERWMVIQLGTYALLAVHVRPAPCAPFSRWAAVSSTGPRALVSTALTVQLGPHLQGGAVGAVPLPHAPRRVSRPAGLAPSVPAVRTLQALAYLGTVWSVDMKARLHFRTVRQLADATHVKVVPHSFVGTKGIVPLHGKATVGPGRCQGAGRLLRRVVSWQPTAPRATTVLATPRLAQTVPPVPSLAHGHYSSDRTSFAIAAIAVSAVGPLVRTPWPPLSRARQEAGPIISFDFRKLHFILDGEANTFRKLKYPTKASRAAGALGGVGRGAAAELRHLAGEWGSLPSVTPSPPPHRHSNCFINYPTPSQQYNTKQCLT